MWKAVWLQLHDKVIKCLHKPSPKLLTIKGNYQAGQMSEGNIMPVSFVSNSVTKSSVNQLKSPKYTDKFLKNGGQSVDQSIYISGFLQAYC